MLKDPLFIAVAVGALIVLVILMIGIGGFAKGGEGRGKKSNKLMQWRIGLQFLAVVLIVIFIWLRGQGGN